MAVLTIQSHVVAGHVGNSAAVFCLQRSGVEAWGLDTLQFSNHTAAKGWTGDVFPADCVNRLVDGLAVCSGLENCDGVLSGYLGAKATGEAVLNTVKRVKDVNADAFYCCDPVMGDNGTLYVAKDIPDFMRNRAVPAADFITPNRFELGWLANQSVNSESDAIAAARRLIGNGRLKAVVVTGLPVGTDGLAALTVEAGAAWRVATPKLKFDASVCCGAGDMTTALLVANFVKTSRLPESLAKAVSSVWGIIKAAEQTNAADIPLIAAQSQIAAPDRIFKAERI